MSTFAIKPIPLDSRENLNDMPLHISDRIFNEMKSQGEKDGYKKVQVLPTDPEWRFVWRYFHNDKPHRYGIKRIFCIYEKYKQKTFEFNLSSIEMEASEFKPKWNQEPRAQQRTQAIERWKQAADVFSPFFTMDEGRKRNWKYAKIMPLWHISSKLVCNAVSGSGFIYFGKTSKSQNNDYDFSENGVYFTNSARYASDVYNEKDLFLTWVCMKEPFPIVGDSKADIETFRVVYKDYNEYYVPVTSISFSDNDSSIEEKPHCDEFVVFHRSQTLPRFWIELAIELTSVPSDTPQFVNELIPHIMKLLQNPHIDEDERLRNYLCKELEFLLILEEDDYLGEKYESFYKKLTQLLDSQGKVDRQVSLALIQAPHASVTHQSHKPVQSITTTTSNNLPSSQPSYISPKNSIPLSFKITASSSISDIAFGKADWEKYFGDIGIEPPLPTNIADILNEPCPFWHDKKVKETHLLVLIPNTVNGRPFTLNHLGDLIQKPRSGHETKYKCYHYEISRKIGAKSNFSHWVLMTRDVIPGSRDFYKDFSYKKKLLASYSKKANLPYEMPYTLEAATSILMHYVKTGEHLYTEDNLGKIYTRCQDTISGVVFRLMMSFKFISTVGCFDEDGLDIRTESNYSRRIGVAGSYVLS